MTDESTSSGGVKGPLISALVTALGLYAAIYPSKVRIGILAQHSDQVVQLFGSLLSMLGYVGAQLSRAPAFLRGPWLDVKHWITVSVLKRKVTS